MINALLAAAILSTSFSVRTANDVDKPLDYEFSVKAENNEGNFTYNLKRDWERELGVKYIDDTFKFNHKVKFMYYGIDYVNKESKDIFYTTYNTGFQTKAGIKFGLALKEQDGEIKPLANLGLSTGAKIKDLENNPNYSYIISMSIKTDINENNIFNIKSEIKKWFGRFNIFGLYKHEYYNEKEDFQFKVGIGVKLWN